MRVVVDATRVVLKTIGQHRLYPAEKAFNVVVATHLSHCGVALGYHIITYVGAMHILVIAEAVMCSSFPHLGMEILYTIFVVGA